MRARKWFLLLLLVPALFSLSFLRNPETPRANDTLLRLHVKANSNSPADQAVKYQVRDAVLAVLAVHLDAAGNADAATASVEAVLPEVAATAQATLQEAGFAYPVRASLGKANFPTRLYGDKVYRAGKYQALQIFIGEGSGENWWCVLFPPLCFAEAAPDTAIPVHSGDDHEPPRPKSRILEWLQRLFTGGA